MGRRAERIGSVAASLGAALATALVGLALVAPPPAAANFAGIPGPIAYQTFEGIKLLDPTTGASEIAVSEHGGEPALFPGSDELAYIREVGSAPAPDKPGFEYTEYQLYVKSLADGDPAAPGQPLFGPQSFLVRADSVTPNGQRIVFSARRGLGPGSGNLAELEIWSCSVAGTNLRRLTRNDVFDNDPEVSPDGRHIAFVRRVDGRGQIFVMGIGGGDQHRLTFDDNRDRAPSWSPNGRRIVYFSQLLERDGTASSRELFTVPAAGGHTQRLTHDSVDESYPAYSPDGSQIAFIEGNYLEAMPAGGGAPRRLTEQGYTGIGAPDWGTAAAVGLAMR